MNETEIYVIECCPIGTEEIEEAWTQITSSMGTEEFAMGYLVCLGQTNSPIELRYRMTQVE